MNPDPTYIKKFQSTEHAIAWLAEAHGVLCFKEDFMAARKSKILTIHVASAGVHDTMVYNSLDDRLYNPVYGTEGIQIYNPEYSIRWHEKIGMVVHTLYRMAKSRASREYIIQSFRRAYTKIDDHEYVDAFEKHTRETNLL